MITQAEYAVHAGLTKGRVSQLVRAGMPLGSFDEADTWRRTKRRAGPPIRIPGARAPGQDPAPALEAPKAPPEPAAPVNPPVLQRPPDAADPVAQSEVNQDSPEGAYQRARQIERAAYSLAVKALRAGQPDAARLVAVHQASLGNLTKARNDVLDLQEREGTLVSADWVRRTMLEHDGAVVTIAKSMPRSLSGRIAPHDPEHAEKELARWVQEDLLRTLYSTNPWTT